MNQGPSIELAERSASLFDEASAILDPSETEVVPARDFRNPPQLSKVESRALQLQLEKLVQAVEARLAAHLRSEFSLKCSAVETLSYEKLTQGWERPSHFILFKIEPLRGVSILEISNQLGMSMVDRLMGGPGRATETEQGPSEIEKALLEKTGQTLLEEWCGNWSIDRKLKPVILDYESVGAFIQTASAQTAMLVVFMEAEFAGGKGQIQVAFPYAAVAPLLRPVSQKTEAAAKPARPKPAPKALKWNNCFNDIPVAVTAEWSEFELTPRQILALKVGDVLPLAVNSMQQINVRIAETFKFQGRPGTVAGKWAVQLTQPVSRQS